VVKPPSQVMRVSIGVAVLDPERVLELFHHQTAPTATPNKTAANKAGETTRRTGLTEAGTAEESRPDSESSFNSSSAIFTSCMSRIRRCGSFRRQRLMILSSSGGTASASSPAGRGSLLRIAVSVDIFVSPWKARCPSHHFVDQ
jgi:hypothetical protein